MSSTGLSNFAQNRLIKWKVISIIWWKWLKITGQLVHETCLVVLHMNLLIEKFSKYFVNGNLISWVQFHNSRWMCTGMGLHRWSAGLLKSTNHICSILLGSSWPTPVLEFCILPLWSSRSWWEVDCVSFLCSINRTPPRAFGPPPESSITSIRNCPCWNILLWPILNYDSMGNFFTWPVKGMLEILGLIVDDRAGQG